MTVTHLDLFYQTRASFSIGRTDPSNNPNTSLSEVPDEAEISFPDHTRRIDAENFEAPNGRGFETARFLISRAMMDPEAVVTPMSELPDEEIVA